MTAQTSREADRGSTGADDGGGGDGETLVARASPDVRAEGSDSLARRIARADLLKRVFEVDALRCPACGGRMRLLAAITEPSVARRILECLSLPPRAPPLALASEFDREPVISRRGYEPTLAEADGDPGFDFDPSQAEDPDSNQVS